MSDEMRKLEERVERLERAVFPIYTVPYTVNNHNIHTFYPTPLWSFTPGPYGMEAEYTVSG